MGYGPMIFQAFFDVLSYLLDMFYDILIATGLFGWFIAGMTLFMGVRLVAQPLMGIRYGSDIGSATKNVVNRFSGSGSSKGSGKSSGGSKGG